MLLHTQHGSLYCAVNPRRVFLRIITRRQQNSEEFADVGRFYRQVQTANVMLLPLKVTKLSLALATCLIYLRLWRLQPVVLLWESRLLSELISWIIHSDIDQGSPNSPQ